MDCTKEKTREIPKEIDPPEFTLEAIGLINEVLFGKQDSLENFSGPILLFGTSQKANRTKLVEEYFRVRQTVSMQLTIITGGRTGAGPSESSMIAEQIDVANFPDTEFALDQDSTNTLENVQQALRLGLGNYPRVLFITKWPHCGRSRLTLVKYLPGTEIIQSPYEPVFAEDQSGITPGNWFLFPQVAKLVWGEFNRVQLYGERGDIAYPQNIRDKVRYIRALCGTK